MSPDSTPGRSLVTHRAIVDVVGAATLGAYGVTGLSAGPVESLLAALDLAHPGIRIELGDGLEIELDIDVALGVPVAEVARQLESAVRYAVERSLGIEVRRLAIHVDGLRVEPGGLPPHPDAGEADRTPARPIRHRTARTAADRPRPRDLAESGTDVA